ncbi:MAG: 1,4-dihydroxy-2-naphthoate octaprenyltransferase [Bacteroidia bacterium]|nr:1,4-dihydroxy-2-naphthoate octaprenyltransferase [Bacteroidia bacterium]MBT8276175.1 1,4-dihydroxy-2-naphthoate octaprenyltransferase [Bacteroidia bacterium]NNF31987.1 1,4-dihydroxy-2-naphthoate octaprenyltransferase [Flavobacteriaceae bacterium]NNK52950.1 1,4-dihydroxy-2-naphthoate octaprenyltransferase [Flavobacteriaceae bacterium]NNM09687.1 1,4-dihydroxy-2-naphthoate octaprenyltransferase [Flavobacteriaceae bacterium]
MSKVKAWVSAARLRTLPLSVSGIIAGSASAYAGDSFRSPVFILAIATTLGFQILSNFANDYGDGVKGTDNKDRVGPARALQSGLLKAKELKRGMIITSAITLLLASMLIYAAFGKDNFLLSFIFFNLGIAAIIAAITYTVGTSAYGYRALGDLFVFVFFGMVGVMGCYFLYTQNLGELIILPAITIGLLSTAVLNLNNMRDRISDSKVNKNTLAVILGGKRVKYYHAFLIFFAFISASLYIWISFTEWQYFIPLVAFVPLFLNVIKVFKTEDATKLDPELKKVALSTFLFALLLFAMNFI